MLLAYGAANGQYAGSQKCKDCHPKQSEGHAATGHARALTKPAEHPLASSFPKQGADWAFGAGEQAVTFVSYLDEDYYLEHGLSYFSRSKQLAITPGHAGSAGERYRTFDPGAAILKCFQCHTTGPLKLAEGFRIVPFEAGVQCEACHGPGGEHVRLKGARSAIRSPRALNAAALNELCGACHRKPPAAGDDTNWNNAWNARHQPLYFSQSRCFTESEGKLSCLSCHAAHTTLSRTDGDYDRTCSGCHQGVKHRTATERRSCVGCHMPDVRPGGVDLRFSNHWIGVYKPGDSLRPTSRH